MSVVRNILQRLKETLADGANAVKNTIKHIFHDVKTAVTSLITSEGAKFTKTFVLYTILYGFLLNYALHILLSFPFNRWTVPAWGIVYYLVREEVVDMLVTIKQGRINRG